MAPQMTEAVLRLNANLSHITPVSSVWQISLNMLPLMAWMPQFLMYVDSYLFYFISDGIHHGLKRNLMSTQQALYEHSVGTQYQLSLSRHLMGTQYMPSRRTVSKHCLGIE